MTTEQSAVKLITKIKNFISDNPTKAVGAGIIVGFIVGAISC